MPKYFYTAITSTGEKISGSEIAADERRLARILREKGYLLTTVKTGEEGGRMRSPLSFLKGMRRVSLTDKFLFTRNLQVMVAAGVPLPKALDILSAQTSNKGFRAILSDVKKEVLEGKSLSEAMENHPSVFPDLFTNMIKVGEESGTLEQVLSQLSLQLERSHELRSRVVGALMYPSVVIVAMLGVGTLMLMVVIPLLAQTFELEVPKNILPDESTLISFQHKEPARRSHGLCETHRLHLFYRRVPKDLHRRGIDEDQPAVLNDDDAVERALDDVLILFL